MTPTDLRTLCTALSFTAIAMQPHNNSQDDADRALGLAELMQEFCQNTAQKSEPENLITKDLYNGDISMPRAKTTSQKNSKDIKTFLTEPWVCDTHHGIWNIKAYNLVTGTHEMVATVPATTSGFSSETLAKFIIQTVNTHISREELINELTAALELCLECEGLNWAAEHDADIALRHARMRA